MQGRWGEEGDLPPNATPPNYNDRDGPPVAYPGTACFLCCSIKLTQKEEFYFVEPVPALGPTLSWCIPHCLVCMCSMEHIRSLTKDENPMAMIVALVTLSFEFIQQCVPSSICTPLTCTCTITTAHCHGVHAHALLWTLMSMQCPACCTLTTVVANLFGRESASPPLVHSWLSAAAR